MRKILLIEDESDIRQLMSLHLKRAGYDVTEAENGEIAQKLVQANRYDLLVVDWMLPGVSGLEICKQVAKAEGAAKPPVLMVTAKVDPTDIVEGLDSGADDYVSKPFENSVFLARVRALLRRGTGVAAQPQNGAGKYSFGALALDENRHEVVCEGQVLALTPSEFKLLAALMKSEGKVLSRRALVDLVQGQDVAVIERTVDTHVFGLRKN